MVKAMDIAFPLSGSVRLSAARHHPPRPPRGRSASCSSSAASSSPRASMPTLSSSGTSLLAPGHQTSPAGAASPASSAAATSALLIAAAVTNRSARARAPAKKRRWRSRTSMEAFGEPARFSRAAALRLAFAIQRRLKDPLSYRPLARRNRRRVGSFRLLLYQYQPGSPLPIRTAKLSRFEPG